MNAVTRWVRHPAKGELEQVREINAHLPFADPIGLAWETGPIPANAGWVRFEGWLPRELEEHEVK